MKEELFTVYYKNWINTYKKGAVREVTLRKYQLTLSWIEKIVPELKMKDINRITYQNIINEYAENHEKQTVIDFHHHLKSAILDAVDEGIIERDPTRRIVLKGKAAKHKKPKYLNQFELKRLLEQLELGEQLSYDWLILLIAKTGMRFSEALGLTPEDFDYRNQTVSITKTWDYKSGGGFVDTKNKSSVRKVRIDWQMTSQFAGMTKELEPKEPIFVEKGKDIYSSTVNGTLARHCRKAGIPVISIHGLRHTHASILLYSGVSIASVSRRLGHSNMSTTQKVYLHVIKELENQDNDLVMRTLSVL